MKILRLPSPALAQNNLFLQKINFRLISRLSIVAQAIVCSLYRILKSGGSTLVLKVSYKTQMILYICFGFSLSNKLTNDAFIPGKLVMDIPGLVYSAKKYKCALGTTISFTTLALDIAR